MPKAGSEASMSEKTVEEFAQDIVDLVRAAVTAERNQIRYRVLGVLERFKTNAALTVAIDAAIRAEPDGGAGKGGEDESR